MGTFLGGETGREIAKSVGVTPKPTAPVIVKAQEAVKKAADAVGNAAAKVYADISYNPYPGSQYSVYQQTDDYKTLREAGKTAYLINRNNKIGTAGPINLPAQTIGYYNDPYQINSITDLFNVSVMKHNYGSWNLVQGVKDLIKNNKASGWNILTGLGEAADAIANPIKAITAPLVASAARMDYQDALEITSYWQNREAMTSDSAYTYAKQAVDEELAKQGITASQLGAATYSRLISEAKTEILQQWDSFAPAYDAKTGYYTFKTESGNTWMFTESDYYNYIEEIVNSGRTVNPYALRPLERLDAATLGIATDYGHLNYNYESGAPIADFFLEVISDPDTIARVAKSAISSGMVDAVGTGMRKGLIQAADIIDNTKFFNALVPNKAVQKQAKEALVKLFDNNRAVKRLNNEALEYARKGAIKAVSKTDKQFLEMLTGIALKSDTLSQTFKVTYDQAAQYALYKAFKSNVNITPRMMYRALETIKVAKPTEMTKTILDSLNKFEKVYGAVDNVQKYLMLADLPSIGLPVAVTKLIKENPGAAKWIAHNIEKLKMRNIAPAGEHLTEEGVKDARHAIDDWTKANKLAGVAVDADDIQQALAEVSKVKEDFKLKALLEAFNANKIGDLVAAVDEYITNTYAGKFKNWVEFYASDVVKTEEHARINKLYSILKEKPSLKWAGRHVVEANALAELLEADDIYAAIKSIPNADQDPLLHFITIVFDEKYYEDLDKWYSIAGDKKALKAWLHKDPVLKHIPTKEVATLDKIVNNISDAHAYLKLIPTDYNGIPFYKNYEAWADFMETPAFRAMLPDDPELAKATASQLDNFVQDLADKYAKDGSLFVTKEIKAHIAKTFTNYLKQIDTTTDIVEGFKPAAKAQTVAINKLLTDIGARVENKIALQLKDNVETAILDLKQYFTTLGELDINDIDAALNTLSDDAHSKRAEYIYQAFKEAEPSIRFLNNYLSDAEFNIDVARHILEAANGTTDKLSRFESIMRLLNTLTTENGFTDQEFIVKTKDALLTIIDPYKSVKLADLQQTIEFKLEQSAALFQLMQDPATQDIRRTIIDPDSAFNKYLTAITKDDARYQEAQEILHMFDAADAVQTFYTALDTNPNIREDVAGAVKQAIQRVYDKSARDVTKTPKRLNTFIDSIIDSANVTLRETMKTKSYSVEAAYNHMMAALDENWVYKKETHLSEQDIMMQHALIEQLPDIKKLRDELGYTLLTIDWETANERVSGLSNKMLNWASTSDGKTLAGNAKINEDVAKLFKPAPTYLNENFNGDFKKWLKAMSATNGVATEDELIVSFYKHLTEQYEASGQKLCVLGHNSNRFDFSILEQKLKDRALLKKIYMAGADPDILSKCVVVDTLDELYKIDAKAGLFSIINEKESEAIREALTNYLDLMCSDTITTNRMFSLVNSNEMRMLESFVKDALAQASKEANKYVFSDFLMLKEKITNYFNALNDIHLVNKSLSNNPLLASLFNENTDRVKEIRQYIFNALKEQHAGLDDAAINNLIDQRFGINLELLSPTKLTAVEGFAFRYHFDLKTVSDFCDIAEMEGAQLTDYEAKKISTLCRKLKRSAQPVNIDVVARNYDKIYAAVVAATANEPIGRFLTESMSPADLGAMFAYYYGRGLWAANTLKTTKGLSAEDLSRITRIANRFDVLAKDLPQDDVIAICNTLGFNIFDWERLCDNGLISDVLKWAGVRQALNNNITDLPGYSQQLEHLGIAAADAQAKYAVLQPVAELAKKLRDYWRTKFGNHAFERELSKHIKQQTFESFNARPAEVFKHLTHDDMENWLAYSGGVCIVPGKATHPTIKTFYDIEKDCTIFYLDKSTNYRIISDGETVRYFVRDKEYTAAPWKKIVDTGVNTQLIPDIDLQPHIDRLAWHTDNNSRMSTLTTLNNSQYKKMLKELPEEVVNDFIEPHDFWVLNNTMNHTDYSGKYLPMSSDMYARVVMASTNVVENHNSINNYIGAFMTKGSELKSSELGKLMLQNPAEAVAYLKAHPEFVLVSCVPDAKAKQGYTIVKHSADNAIEAINNGAFLYEDYVADRMIAAVNGSVFEGNKIINLHQKLERLYKLGYLFARPASNMRNWLDTVMKTRGETGENYGNIIMHQAQAFKEIREFDNIMDAVYKARNENVPLSSWLKSDAVKDLCKANGVSHDWFIEMYRIMQESSINGEISTIAKATRKQRLETLDNALSHNAVTASFVQGQKRRQDFNSLSSFLLGGFSKVEQVSRLAQYNILKEQGVTIAERFKSIKHAQFNYEVKTPFVQTMELFMPFFNFQYNNMIWWYDTLMNNTWFIRELENILDPLYDLGQYDPETLNDPDNIFSNNNTTLDNILAGNIKITDDTWLVTGNSLMDLLGWLQPLDKLQDTIFSPWMDLIIKPFLKYCIAPDASATVSQWLFENFGTELNEEAVKLKFGEWAENYIQYREDYKYKTSYKAVKDGAVSLQDWVHRNYYKLSLVPLVGTLVGNAVNTGAYLMDRDIGRALSASKILPTRISQNERDDVADKATAVKLYYRLAHLLDQDIAGVRDQFLAACKANGVDPNCNLYSLDYITLMDILQSMEANMGDSNMSLFDALYTYNSDNMETAWLIAVDEDTRYVYSRLKYALGYGDVKLSDCPPEVQQVLNYYISDGFVPMPYDLKIESEDLKRFWEASLEKYNVADVPYEKIPTPIINKMFDDVAESCMLVTDIMNAFDTIDGAGYIYAKVRDDLGLKGLKLNQWPTEFLQVAWNAIQAGRYNQYHWSRNKSNYIPSNRKYSKQTYGSPKHYYTEYTKKLNKHGMYLNYSHSPYIYEKQFINYSRYGFRTMNKIQQSVYQGISPSTLSQIRKDLKYKFYR